MRNKDSFVNVKNLNPLLKKQMALFDLMHKNLTGTQSIITSGNDGKHWGSIKEKYRPDGWKLMDEEEIRQYSNSKHYKDDAVDSRRWNFDNLNSETGDKFLKEVNEIFPKNKFDFVIEFNHFHIEVDIKKVKFKIIKKLKEKSINLIEEFKNRMPRLKLNKVRSPDRIKTDGESMALLMDRADDGVVFQDEKDLAEVDTTIPLYHFYKRPGFKRITGVAVGVGGFVLRFFPKYQLLGEVVMAAGGSLGIFGYGHSLKKNLEKDQNTYVDKIKMFKKIAEMIIKIVKVIMPLIGKLTKKGDS